MARHTIGDLSQRFDGQRRCIATCVRGPVTEIIVLLNGVGGLITKDITLMVILGSLVVGATTLTASSSILVTEATSGYRYQRSGHQTSGTNGFGAKPSVLVVCLRNFTCHTKHLKMFYM